jgi:hypothetical protein
MRECVNHSNRLYNGDVHDFHEACRAMIAQYRQERHWITTKYQPVDPEDAAKGLAEMDGYIADVEQCRKEYAAALRDMEQALIARWGASDHDIPVMLAEALSEGDYSKLAL